MLSISFSTFLNYLCLGAIGYSGKDFFASLSILLEVV
jgi:hypothetical protein